MRRLAPAFTLCTLATLIACAPPDELEPDVDLDIESDESTILMDPCPGAAGTVCSGTGSVYTSVLRVVRAGGYYSEVAQTFTVATPGYPDHLRLPLRLLRALPVGETPDVRIALRPAPGGVVPLDSAGDIATIVVPVASIARIRPPVLDLAFVPTNPSTPAKLTVGTWALVVSVPNGDGAQVGVATLQAPGAFGGESSLRRGPLTDLTRPFQSLLAGGNVVAFAVTLRALAIASAAPTSLTFSPTYVGQQSATQTVTVTNSGDGTMTVTPSVSAQFVVASNTCAAGVSPGGSCAVGVAYAPTASGAATGTLTLTTNAVGGNVSVPLSGSGVLALLLSGTVTDYVVATALGTPTQAVDVTVDIASGATVRGSTNTVPALSTGTLPAGSIVRIINRGQILGGNTTADGATGGTAIRVVGNVPVTLENRGNVFGAGGNGGRGGRSSGAGGRGACAQSAATAGATSNFGGFGYGGSPATSSGGGAAGAPNTYYGASTNGTAGAGGNSCYVGNAPWAGGGNGTGGSGAGYGGGAGGCSIGYGGCGGGGDWGGAGGAGALDNAQNSGNFNYSVNGTPGGNGGAAIEIPAGYSGTISITTFAGSAIAGAVWNDRSGRYYTGSFTTLASTSGKTADAPAGLVTWNNGIGIVYR